MIQTRIKQGAQIISVAICICLAWLLTLKADNQPIISSNQIPPILRTKAPIRNWKYICIHHSATKQGSAARFDIHHRKRGMENGLAYHFVIGNGTLTKDGQIEVGNRWIKQLPGGHVKSDELNKIAIGICLVGNFTQTEPSAKQLDALVNLVVKLIKTYNLKLENVVRHRDLGYSVCPGDCFPWQEVRYRIERELENYE